MNVYACAYMYVNISVSLSLTHTPCSRHTEGHLGHPLARVSQHHYGGEGGEGAWVSTEVTEKGLLLVSPPCLTEMKSGRALHAHPPPPRMPPRAWSEVTTWPVGLEVA